MSNLQPGTSLHADHPHERCFCVECGKVTIRCEGTPKSVQVLCHPCQRKESPVQ